MDAIRLKICSWPRQTLSYAGKVELIRSVVEGIECYWLSILPLPSNIIGTIYGIFRKFIWQTKRPPIAWKKLCTPTVDGGLGLKDLSAWNKALLPKTLWNIHRKQDTLWIKWINQIYNNRESVWAWQWNREQSPLIKHLLQLRDILIQRNESAVAVIGCLESWYTCTGGVSKAYDFSVGKIGNWPWKPIIWKSCILPKHRYALWIFSHGKFLTKID